MQHQECGFAFLDFFEVIEDLGLQYVFVEIHTFLAYGVIDGHGLPKLVSLLPHHSWPVLHASRDRVLHVIDLWLQVWLKSPLGHLQILSLQPL